MKKYIRPSWDEYFLEVMEVVARRGTCDRGRCGAVAVLDKRVLATGYVGAPRGMPHCDEIGHQLKTVVHEDGHSSIHCVRTVHAEQNLICQAAYVGISLKGATVYTRMTPCRTCAMLLINSGISRVVCTGKYHQGVESEEMFAKAGLKLEFWSKEVVKYKGQEIGK